MLYKKENGVKSNEPLLLGQSSPSHPIVRLPCFHQKLILMISLFGEDISSIIMQHLARMCKQETIGFRMDITEKFKKTYGTPWIHIMRDINPPPRLLNMHHVNHINHINHINYMNNMVHIFDDYVDHEIYTTNNGTRVLTTKNSNKNPPIMDKRSKKARSSYLKKESRRQMKMIKKR